MLDADRKARERAFHDTIFPDNARAPVERCYEVALASREYYRSLILDRTKGADVLEYGCGPDSHDHILAPTARTFTGIDISPVAVQQANSRAESLGLGNVTFNVMDAEELSFPDAAFDLICGMGIIHHLDVKRAFAEIARTLRPDGCAVFLEPLGHNPAINLFRRLTPHLRTVDEHPLRKSDLRLAEGYFGCVRIQYFDLITLLGVPFSRVRPAKRILRALSVADRVLLSRIPVPHLLAWRVVIAMTRPYQTRGDVSGTEGWR